MWVCWICWIVSSPRMGSLAATSIWTTNEHVTRCERDRKVTLNFIRLPVFFSSVFFTSGWWFQTFFVFHNIRDNHHPNWRTHISQRGCLNHQPDMISSGMSLVCRYVAESAIFVQWTGQSPTEPSFRHFSGSKIRNAKQPADPSGGVLSWKGMKKERLQRLQYIVVYPWKKYLKIGFLCCGFPWINVYYQNQSFNLITWPLLETSSPHIYSGRLGRSGFMVDLHHVTIELLMSSLYPYDIPCLVYQDPNPRFKK